MRRSLTIQEEHLAALRSLLHPSDGREAVAYLLCGRANIHRDPWTESPHRRYLSHHVIPIDHSHVLSASRVHVRTKTGTFARLLKQARDERLTVAVVHSHPEGQTAFSSLDDTEEPHLSELAQNRNGPDAEVISVVLERGGRLFGRVWLDQEKHAPLAMVRVVGERFVFDFEGRLDGHIPESLHRQALAFGPALNADVASLNIGIIGCGATGSATGMLLARIGARRLLAVDDDAVATTNLNRLHGANLHDAQQQTQKVEVMKRTVEALGLGTHVETYRGWVGSPDLVDALRSCDIIFGCTDDHDGRMLLNRLAYFYLIPVFDMGVRIDVTDDSPPRLIEAAGRVTTILPGARCLLCRNVVDASAAHAEQLLRNNPGEYQRQLEEKYVKGGGRPDPSVVTFTTDVACMAVDELIHRLTGYRSVGSLPNRVRKYALTADKRPGPSHDELCPVCIQKHYWGRGDIEPFLDRVG